MNIAFDAKRAYQNGTGLGHYSRALVASLAEYYPEHQYYMMAPKVTNRFAASAYPNVHAISPQNTFSKVATAFWRSKGVIADLKQLHIDLYHGLSHEIPIGIQTSGIPSVVTMHDLIFERFPEQFGKINCAIYRFKFQYAAQNANAIIAVSEQTKMDLVEYYKIHPDKIHVCYQSCHPSFSKRVSVEERERIRAQYQLPDQFFLYVGSIVERKNLLAICKAYAQLGQQLSIPLVVIGNGNQYKKQVQQFISSNGLASKIRFLNDDPVISKLPGYQLSTDFPALYQLATAMVYPSVFEGFGIPVLEAMSGGTPTITSNISSLAEVGGDGAYLVDPFSIDALAQALLTVAKDEGMRKWLQEKGRLQAEKFSRDTIAAKVMSVYQSIK